MVQIKVNFCISDLNYDENRKPDPKIFMTMLCTSAAFTGNQVMHGKQGKQANNINPRKT